MCRWIGKFSFQEKCFLSHTCLVSLIDWSCVSLKLNKMWNIATAYIKLVSSWGSSKKNFMRITSSILRQKDLKSLQLREQKSETFLCKWNEYSFGISDATFERKNKCSALSIIRETLSGKKGFSASPEQPFVQVVIVRKFKMSEV